MLVLFQRAAKWVELALSTIATGLQKLEKSHAHGASSGRGWKSPIERFHGVTAFKVITG